MATNDIVQTSNKIVLFVHTLYDMYVESKCFQNTRSLFWMKKVIFKTKFVDIHRPSKKIRMCMNFLNDLCPLLKANYKMSHNIIANTLRYCLRLQTEVIFRMNYESLRGFRSKVTLDFLMIVQYITNVCITVNRNKNL